MYERDPQHESVREVAVERTYTGRVLAVGTVVLWLVTLLLISSPSAVRGIF